MNSDEILNRPLDERESSILRALVYEYIYTGKPVGSRSFVQKYSFSISPATMRNIMFDLEAMGFLMQPHTSAGRIPTDSGYRFYVNSLLDSYDFKLDEQTRVKEEFLRKEIHLDKIFTSITKMLSIVSRYAGVMLTPNPDYTVVKRFDLVPIGNNELLVILVTRTGLIINKRVTLSVSVISDDLYEYSKYLTGELCGYSIHDIKDSVIGSLRTKKPRTANNDMALDIAELALGDIEEPMLHIDGIENLLKIPEMVEEERLNSLLNIIEEKDILRYIMERNLEKDGINTLIGNEIADSKVSGCSMVSSAYKIGNKRVGVIGIIGPTRMDYEKTVPLVDYTSRVISDFLTNMSK